MSKKPFKGNYLTLENVRISYDPKNDSIHLTSKDSDIPKGESFHLTLNTGRDAERILRTMLEDKKMMPEGYLKALPSQAVRPLDAPASPWDKFPLGIGRGGREIAWDVSNLPNLLLAGGTGSGKSVIERLIFQHCFDNPENWRVMGIDLKRVEFSPYINHPQVISISTTIQNAAAATETLHGIMMDRYQLMEATGVNNIKDLPSKPFSIMLIVDESAMLLSKSGIKTPEGIAEDALKRTIRKNIEDIARLGRSAGVHLALATQRADADVFGGEFKANFSVLAHIGRASHASSYVLLGNDNATKVAPSVRGRGYIQMLGAGEECQFYYRPAIDTAIPQERAKSTGEQALYEIAIRLADAAEEVKLRYSKMEAENVVYFKELKSPPAPLVVFVDEYDTMENIAPDDADSLSYKDLKERINNFIVGIARIGRSAGVSIVVRTNVELGSEDANSANGDINIDFFNDAKKVIRHLAVMGRNASIREYSLDDVRDEAPKLYDPVSDSKVNILNLSEETGSTK